MRLQVSFYLLNKLCFPVIRMVFPAFEAFQDRLTKNLQEMNNPEGQTPVPSEKLGKQQRPVRPAPCCPVSHCPPIGGSHGTLGAVTEPRPHGTSRPSQPKRTGHPSPLHAPPAPCCRPVPIPQIPGRPVEGIAPALLGSYWSPRADDVLPDPPDWLCFVASRLFDGAPRRGGGRPQSDLPRPGSNRWGEGGNICPDGAHGSACPDGEDAGMTGAALPSPPALCPHAALEVSGEKKYHIYIRI